MMKIVQIFVENCSNFCWKFFEFFSWNFYKRIQRSSGLAKKGKLALEKVHPVTEAKFSIHFRPIYLESLSTGQTKESQIDTTITTSSQLLLFFPTAGLVHCEGVCFQLDNTQMHSLVFVHFSPMTLDYLFPPPPHFDWWHTQNESCNENKHKGAMWCDTRVVTGKKRLTFPTGSALFCPSNTAINNTHRLPHKSHLRHQISFSWGRWFFFEPVKIHKNITRFSSSYFHLHNLLPYLPK